MDSKPAWKRRALPVLMLLGWLTATPLTAQEGPPAVARVVSAVGDAWAINADGTSRRELARRSPIYAGETLVTGEALLQVRFMDRALASIGCHSELLIEDYQYLDLASDRSHLLLKQGRVRTVTGTVQRSNYRFRTELVTIRPAGTEFEVYIESPGLNYLGVYDGSIRVETALGVLTLGPGPGQPSFGVANDADPPQGVPVQPPQLGAMPILSPSDPDKVVCNQGF